jgi:hypothetical protein
MSGPPTRRAAQPSAVPPAQPEEVSPPSQGPETAAAAPRALRSLWSAISVGFGVLLGLVPQVLHHIGIFAGAFLVAGAVGNMLFGLLGLLLSLPLLRRLYQRFGSWKAPAVGIGVFIAGFSLSAFVLGPALTGTGASGEGGDPSRAPTPSGSSTPTGEGHDAHHD